MRKLVIDGEIMYLKVAYLRDRQNDVDPKIRTRWFFTYAA